MGLFKKIKSVFKSAAKVALPFAGAILGNMVLPGLGGTLIGGFLGGKAAGQSTTQALLGSVGSVVGGKFLGPIMGNIASKVAPSILGGLAGKAAASFIGSSVFKSLDPKEASKTESPAAISAQPVSGVTAPAETQVVQANDPKIVEAQRRARRQAANSGRNSTIFAGMDALAPAKVTKKTLLGQ